MTTTTDTISPPRTVTDLLGDLDKHLEKAARAGCSCDTSARETAMHLRRAIKTLATVVIDLHPEVTR